MNNKLALSIFGIVLVLALFGGVWQTSVFASTVPPVVPTQAPTVAAVVPVAGGPAVTQTVEKGKAVESVLTGVGGVGAAADVLPAGEVLSVVKPTNLPSGNTINPIGDPLYASVLDKGVEVKADGKKFEVTFTLTQAQIDAFKKDPKAGILYFDPAKNAWVHLTAVLTGNKLTVETTGLGYFTVGSLK